MNNQPNNELTNEELNQSLLELHYDLLDDAQADALRQRIQNEPSVATAWAQTLRLAGKLASAARIEGVPIPEIKKPTESDPEVDLRRRVISAEPSKNGLTETSAEPKRASDRFWISSLGILATAASLGGLILGARYLDQVPNAPEAVVQMDAQAAISHEAKSDNEFEIKTSLLNGSLGSLPVVPATISFSILSGRSVLFRGSTETHSDGCCTVSVPDDLVIPDGAKMTVTARPKNGTAGVTSIDIPLEPTRCLTYVNVDRPVYRPGETVFFRSVTLNRRSLAAHIDVPIRYQLVDPSGAVVPNAFIEGVTERGVGNGSFVIPSTAPGGPYQLVAKSLDGFFPDEVKEFQVRAYRVPRFKKDLEFRKRSYGAGETVEADFSANRAEGGAVAGAAVRITARVDEQIVYRHNATTSAEGTLAVAFDLPEHINEGVGQLSIAVDDGGVQETQSKTIPIQLGRVAVDFYPEGGYLVDGLQNRVYFAARNPLGEPIHIQGEVLSRSGHAVAKIETVRDGMGRFEFVPKRGEKYTLKVISPVDVTNNPKLPSVVKALPVIDTGEGVFDTNSPLSITVRNTKKLTAVVRAVCRGQLVGQKNVKFKPGATSLQLPVRNDATGVIRVTILDAETIPAQPLVERLVYRREERKLNVSIVDPESKLKRSPGEPLRLTLQVTDENGAPAPAVLGVSVVDDASLSLDETERPTLRTHFLLTSEVEKPEDLEHANFYLSDGAEAAQSLDLLLGTQGWRRFISGSEDQADLDFREQLVRLFELDGTSAAEPKQKISNAPVFVGGWQRYRQQMADAWSAFMSELRFLALILFGLFMLLVLYNLRRKPSTVAAMVLLIVTTSLLVSGCGSSARLEQVNSAIATDSQSTPARNQMAAKTMPDATMPSLEMEEMPADPMSDAADELEFDDAMGGAMPPSETTKNIPSKDALSASASQQRKQLDRAGDAQSAAGAGFGPPGLFTKRDQRSEMDVVERLATDSTLSPDALQRLMAARGLDAQSLADELLDELRFPVREYAHRYKKPADNVRSDFTETLYWQPMLPTDSTGKAVIRFDLADSVTTFRVNVDGHTANGRIGSGGGKVTSRIPFQIEPKLPLEVTTGDRIDLPVAVINATEDDISVNVDLNVGRSLKRVDEETVATSVAAGQRKRAYFAIEVADGSAEHDVNVELRGTAGSANGDLSDSIRRKIHVAPSGYPIRQSIAGVLNERGKITLPIPKDIVGGSLAVTLRAYPSPMADLMAGVESILREPHGCFEQTSATNYPNAMALMYLQENNIAKPGVSRRAMTLLEKGYGKLTSFECTKRGYEWFGKDPGHEALSAFGLMQFNDMQKIMEVDNEMVVRTRAWLMKRRDGEGGFNRNPRHLHVWSVQQEIVNAYVLWAITEADVAAQQPQRSAVELGRELKQLNKTAKASDDPYLIALSAAALMNARMTDDGLALLEKIAEMQAADGSLDGKTTVTSSGGISRKVETTAIATLAWLKNRRFKNNAQSAAKWIVANRRGTAGFGSTQATVLALKALVAVSSQSAQSSGGKLKVRLGSKTIGEVKLPSDPKSGDLVEIKGLGTHLDDIDGEAKIELIAKGNTNLPYTIDVAYNAITPNSHESCPLKIKTEFLGDKKQLKAGDTINVRATLENTTESGQPMTVAIVGLPGGVEPKAEQLDEMKEAERFDFYELRGREVIFYWRTIEPNAEKQIEFTVTATVPGKYTAPASRTYLYYTAEQKSWTKPLKVQIDR